MAERQRGWATTRFVRHRMAELTAQVMETEMLGLKVLEAMVRERNATVDAAMNKVIHTVTCQDIARAVLDFGGPEALGKRMSPRTDLAPVPHRDHRRWDHGDYAECDCKAVVGAGLLEPELAKDREKMASLHQLAAICCLINKRLEARNNACYRTTSLQPKTWLVSSPTGLLRFDALIPDDINQSVIEELRLIETNKVQPDYP